MLSTHHAYHICMVLTFSFKVFENVEEMQKVISSKPNKNRIIFRYLLSPTKIMGTNGMVSSALYQSNTLIIKDGVQTVHVSHRA